MKHYFSKSEYFKLVEQIKEHILEVREHSPEISHVQALQEFEHPFPYSPAKRAIFQLTGQWIDSETLLKYAVADWKYCKYVEELWADYRSVYG